MYDRGGIMVFVENEEGRDVVLETGKIDISTASQRLQDGRIKIEFIRGTTQEELRNALDKAGLRISGNQEPGVPIVTIDKIESRNA